MSNDFKENHPELARRLVYAHEMAIEYMYTHPYNAAMMFADGFDVDPYVALRTIYMKTVAEGPVQSHGTSLKRILKTLRTTTHSIHRFRKRKFLVSVT